MTLNELKTQLRIILATEQAVPVDWATVERMSLDLLGKLATGDAPPHPHHVVYHYLDDPDVRRKDAAYGRHQRLRLQQWLEEGDNP